MSAPSGSVGSAPGFTGLYLRQKVTLIANKYWVHGVLDGTTQGPVIAFAEQKKMKLREEVTFFDSEAKAQVLFSFKSRQIIDMAATTDVFDGAGATIGVFRKDAMKSLINSTWHLEAAGVAATGHERSQGVAVIRRVAGFVPGIGELLEAIPWQFHFDFYDASGSLVMSSERQRKLRDQYLVSLPPIGAGAPLDWRVAAAVGVALDAFQGR